MWADPDAPAAVGVIPETAVRSEWTISEHLFDYQQWIVNRPDRERFALFADTGLGKTAMQPDWAVNVHRVTGGRVLIPPHCRCAVRTIAEAARFYDDVRADDLTIRSDLDDWLGGGEGLGITNYEKLDRSGPGDRWGDDSLACRRSGARRVVHAQARSESASCRDASLRRRALQAGVLGHAAPNQRTELAQHAVFLGQVRSTTEYLTAFFVNRDGTGSSSFTCRARGQRTWRRGRCSSVTRNDGALPTTWPTCPS